MDLPVPLAVPCWTHPAFGDVATLTLGLGPVVTAGSFGDSDSVVFQPLLDVTEDRMAVVWDVATGRGQSLDRRSGVLRRLARSGEVVLGRACSLGAFIA